MTDLIQFMNMGMDSRSFQRSYAKEVGTSTSVWELHRQLVCHRAITSPQRVPQDDALAGYSEPVRRSQYKLETVNTS